MFSRGERRRNTETPKQRPGAVDWMGETPAGRCHRGLHLLRRLLHRLHDEGGVVHPLVLRAHAGSYVVYLSLPWCDLYVIMSFVI